jgi:hypothetical protein
MRLEFIGKIHGKRGHMHDSSQRSYRRKEKSERAGNAASVRPPPYAVNPSRQLLDMICKNSTAGFAGLKPVEAIERGQLELV